MTDVHSVLESAGLAEELRRRQRALIEGFVHAPPAYEPACLCRHCSPLLEEEEQDEGLLQEDVGLLTPARLAQPAQPAAEVAADLALAMGFEVISLEDAALQQQQQQQQQQQHDVSAPRAAPSSSGQASASPSPAVSMFQRQLDRLLRRVPGASKSSKSSRGRKGTGHSSNAPTTSPATSTSCPAVVTLTAAATSSSRRVPTTTASAHLAPRPSPLSSCCSAYSQDNSLSLPSCGSFEHHGHCASLCSVTSSSSRPDSWLSEWQRQQIVSELLLAASSPDTATIPEATNSLDRPHHTGTHLSPAAAMLCPVSV